MAKKGEKKKSSKKSTKQSTLSAAQKKQRLEQTKRIFMRPRKAEAAAKEFAAETKGAKKKSLAAASKAAPVKVEPLIERHPDGSYSSANAAGRYDSLLELLLSAKR